MRLRIGKRNWAKNRPRGSGADHLRGISIRFEKIQAHYLVTIEEVQRFSRKIARWHHEGGYDLLLSPTMCIPPTKLGAFQSTPEKPMKWLEVALPFLAITRVQNLTGHPAMSIPLFGIRKIFRLGFNSQAVLGMRLCFSGWPPSWSKQGPGRIANKLFTAAVKYES